jgi:hypothetical protein
MPLPSSTLLPSPTLLLGVLPELEVTIVSLTIEASATECDIGDVVAVRGTLLTEDGEPVLGAAVTARTLHGSTEVDVGEATEEGDGVYLVLVAPSAHGRWHVRMEAAAPTTAAEEQRIHVRRTSFAIA